MLYRSGSNTVLVSAGVSWYAYTVDLADLRCFPCRLIVLQLAGLPSVSADAPGVKLFGLGSISLLPPPGTAITTASTLPFSFAASGIIEEESWLSRLSPEALEELSIPATLEVGRGWSLPLSLQHAQGRITFTSLTEGCTRKVGFTITATGRLFFYSKMADSQAEAPNYSGGVPTWRNGATVVFLQADAAETPDSDSSGTADGSTQASLSRNFRNGSGTVFLAGGAHSRFLVLQG